MGKLAGGYSLNMVKAKNDIFEWREGRRFEA